MELAGRQPFGKLLPRGLHERAVGAQIGQPEPVDAGAFGVEKAGVKLRDFAGGGAVDDDPPEVARAADAFPDVLAAEHFENRVNPLAARQIFDRLDIIALLVVDAVLQSELAYSRELVLGRRSSVHFDAENFADLHGGSADSTGDGVNQDAGAGRLLQQTRLPVGEVGGEEIYWESGGLFRGPIFRNGPGEVAMHHGFFREGGPLRVAHDAASARIFTTCKFAAGGERRLGSAGVPAARGEQIGKVQAARFHFHQKLLGRGMRVGNLLQFENLGPAETSDDECFHGESLTVHVPMKGGKWNPASVQRESRFPNAASASIMVVEFPIPVAWRILWRRGRGLHRDKVRFEGADGNVRASRVGKETLAGIVPASSFPSGVEEPSALSIQPSGALPGSEQN